MDKDNLISTFFESRKNANCILELEKHLLSDEEDYILSSLDIVKELFSQIFEKNLLRVPSSKDEGELKYRQWLSTRYSDFVSHLLANLSHGGKEIQTKSLKVLMTFVSLESKYPLIKIDNNKWYFPSVLFQKIIAELLSDTFDQRLLIIKFKKYLSFDDVKLYTLKALTKVLNQKEEVNDLFLGNCFHILNGCSSTSEESSIWLSQEGIDKPFTLKKKLFSKLFSNVWENFLKFQLPLPLLKKVLLVLSNKVMPQLSNPYFLTDFLTDLYNKGGLLSLLALSGLFELMQKYNVEYPDFYIKLYSLFDLEIINGKYSPRFFYLADLFLSSTHLPACMVAGFVKRLSRLSLMAKSETLLTIIPFICNLLIRHQTLTFLIHRPDPEEVEEDPFDNDVSDPSESKAMESSLWEIKTLQSHINPDVSRKAKVINHPLPKIEYPIDIKDLSVTTATPKLLPLKRKFTEVPTAVEIPAKLKSWCTLSR